MHRYLRVLTGSAQEGRTWGWRRVSCTGCGPAWPCPAAALLTVAGRLGRPVGSHVLEPEVPDGIPALGSGLRDGGTNLQVLLYERTPRGPGCAVASTGEEEPSGMAAPSVLHGCPQPLACSSGPGSSDPSAPAAQLLPLALGGTLTFVPVGWSQRHSPPPRTWKFLGEHHHPLCHRHSGRCSLFPGAWPVPVPQPPAAPFF